MKEAVAEEGRDWSELTPVCRAWLDAARDPSSSSLCFLPCPPLSQSLSSSPDRSPETLAISRFFVVFDVFEHGILGDGRSGPGRDTVVGGALARGAGCPRGSRSSTVLSIIFEACTSVAWVHFNL